MKTLKTITISLALTALIGAGGIYLLQKAPIKERAPIKEETVTDLNNTVEAPVYFATMTHLEKSWKEAATDQDFFTNLVEELRLGMDLAEDYDAVLTIESETPFAEGIVNFGVNILQEALDRGHGVGTHCDISKNREYTTAELVQELKTRKRLIDELVGSENNRGCSGVAGQEWYETMVQAGFEYLDGLVGGHYITIPLAERPEGWTDEAILDDYWHATAPQDPDQRYYPFWVNSDEDFEEDENGDLLISAGDLGGNLLYFAEADPVTGLNTSAKSECRGVCPLTNEDVDELIKLVLDFLGTRDPTRVAKLQVYLPPGIFVPENETVLRYFFSELQKLQEAGELQWASQLEVYEAALKWRDR